jgi:WD40 repeat protein/serine/threonine protein kinase
MSSADNDVPDDPLHDLLLAYDEARQSGRPPPALDAAAPPEVRQRFEHTYAIVKGLERLRDSRPAAEGTSAARPGAAPPALPVAGTQFGHFEILEELGHGAHGVVFRAVDGRTRRVVALKLPRPEVLGSPDLHWRFLREAWVVADCLEHRYIVPVYEADTFGPIPYIASAHCEGPTLGVWLAGQRTPVPARAAAVLVSRVAEAVQHAHERGVLHRDIKPANILLSPPPPPATTDAGAISLELWEPRLTDFGLAKLLEQEGASTCTGVVLGTAAYMAPEQAAGRRGAVGPAADVYSLGVVLYEMLTGKVPFKGATEADTLRQVLMMEPVSPRRLRPDLPRDLAAICLACLHKEPAWRYASAGALADDLQRFLGGKRVRPPRVALRRAWKRVRHHPLTVVLAGVAAAAVLGLVLGGVWHYRKVQEFAQRMPPEPNTGDLAPEWVDRLRRLQYPVMIRAAHQFFERGEIARAVEQLQMQRPLNAQQSDFRGFEWYYLWRLCHRERLTLETTGGLYCVAFSPDGNLLASGSFGGNIQLWDAATGRLRRTLAGHEHCVCSLAFSRDGTKLASVGGIPHKQGDVRLWNVGTGKKIASWPMDNADCSGMAFSPDDKLLAVAGAVCTPGKGVVVQVWEVATGVKRGPFRVIDAVAEGPSLSFTADGQYLAMAGTDRLIHFIHATTGTVVAALPGHTDWVMSVVCFPEPGRPQGEWLASGSLDKTVALWSRASRSRIRQWDHGAPVWSVAYSAELGYLASAGEDGTVQLWDLNDPSPAAKATLKGHRPGVRAVCFAPNGRTLASGGGADGTVKVWDADKWFEVQPLAGHSSEVWSVAFSPDGKTLATGGDDNTVKLWDRASGKLLASLKRGSELVTSVAYAPDGRTVAAANYDNSVTLWDVATGKERKTLEGHPDTVRCVAFSPDGRTLASGGDGGPLGGPMDCAIRLWDGATGTPQGTLAGHSAAVRSLCFTPDGRTLVSVGSDRTIRLWDLGTHACSRHLKTPAKFWSVAVSPDGRTLATGDDAGQVRLWDLATLQERPAGKRGHAKPVFCVAFSPDGRTLASASEDQTIKLWEPTSGAELLTLGGHAARVNAVAFAPDGKALVSGDYAGAVKIWPAAPEPD